MDHLADLNESIQETRKGRNVVSLAEKYFKKYKPQMEILESQSLISKVRSINEWDYYSLGNMLEGFQDYMAICEA